MVTGDLHTMSRSAFKMKVITNGGLYQSGVSKKLHIWYAMTENLEQLKLKKHYPLA